MITFLFLLQTISLRYDVTQLGLGWLIIDPVRLERGTIPGYLGYIPGYDGFVVIVPNAPRSGFGGVVPVPGICIEYAFRPPQPIHSLRDGDHDGDDDIIVQDGATYTVVNLDVLRCR